MIRLYYYNHYLNCCVVTLDLPHLPASASASASLVPLMMDLVPQFELTAGAGCRLQATTGWRVLWLPETTLFYPHLFWRAVDLRLRVEGQGSRMRLDLAGSVMKWGQFCPVLILCRWSTEPKNLSSFFGAVSYSSSSSTLVVKRWRWTPPPRSKSKMVIIIESGSLWDSILGVRKMKKRSWVKKELNFFSVMNTLENSILGRFSMIHSTYHAYI